MKEKTKLQITREKCGISLTELRECTKIPRATYYRYKQQQRLPNVITAIKIVKALNTTVEDLWKPT